MSLDKAENIARAVLYEGYMLYPYRASALKNRQRYGFGTLYPEGHPAALSGTEPCRNRTECLLTGDASTRFVVEVRFLHMRERRLETRLPGADPEFQPVEAMVVDDEVYAALEEAVERQVGATAQLSALLEQEQVVAFEFPEQQDVSELRDRAGEVAGRVIRAQKAVAGRIRMAAAAIADDAFQLSVEVTNCAAPDCALPPVLASAHTLLRIEGGAFVSLLDPPEHLREAARSCRGAGMYPVLVGEPGEHDVLLSSPIILYDYPQIAPESAGDFFDATEMDEMLTLRVMTLTEDEKREVRGGDDRMRQLLERTESTARDQLMRTHGVVRHLRPVEDKAKDEAA